MPAQSRFDNSYEMYQAVPRDSASVDASDEIAAICPRADGAVAGKIRLIDQLHRVSVLLLAVSVVVYVLILAISDSCSEIFETFTGYELLGTSVIDGEEYTSDDGHFTGDILTKNPWHCARKDKTAKKFFMALIFVLAALNLLPLALIRINASKLVTVVKDMLDTNPAIAKLAPDLVATTQSTQPGTWHTVLHSLFGMFLLVGFLVLAGVAVHMGIDFDEDRRVSREDTFDQLLIVMGVATTVLCFSNIVLAGVSLKHLWKLPSVKKERTDAWDQVTTQGYHVASPSKQAISAYNRYIIMMAIWMLVSIVIFTVVTVRSHEVLPHNTAIKFTDTYLANFAISDEDDPTLTVSGYATNLQLYGPSIAATFVMEHMKGARTMVYIGMAITAIAFASVAILHGLAVAGKFEPAKSTRKHISILDTDFLRRIDLFHLLTQAVNFIIAYTLVLFMFHPADDSHHAKASLYVFAAVTVCTIFVDLAGMGIVGIGRSNHTILAQPADDEDDKTQ